MIDVWGADHGGYVKRMKAAVSAITEGKGELDVKLCQLVRVMRNGELVRMSKRAGTFVTLRDLLDEVGPDVVRFTMLTRKNDAPFDFDLAKATEQSRDNPVWYVQYGHARTRSRAAAGSAAGIAIDGLDSAPLDRLADAGELRAGPPDRPMAAPGRGRRRRRTSPIASPSISTTSPPPSMPIGTAAARSRACASSSRATPS